MQMIIDARIMGRCFDYGSINGPQIENVNHDNIKNPLVLVTHSHAQIDTSMPAIKHRDTHEKHAFNEVAHPRHALWTAEVSKHDLAR